MAEETKIRCEFWTGYVQRIVIENEWEALYLGRRSLAERLEDFRAFGQRTSVWACYAFSDRKIALADMLNLAILSSAGELEADYGGQYTETTGPLWLDEKGCIGGHNMIGIFDQHQEEFGALLIQNAPIDLTEIVMSEAAKRDLEEENSCP